MKSIHVAWKMHHPSRLTPSSTYSMAMACFTRPFRFFLGCALALLPLTTPIRAGAAGFEKLQQLPSLGRDPQGIVRGPDGNFYGTTRTGGLSKVGTLFRISATTGTVETLAHFTSTLGAFPGAPVAVDANGNVYGISSISASNVGIWRWNAASGLLLVANLNSPNSTVCSCDPNGGLIGITGSGGANGLGVLWRWHPVSGLQTLGDFAAGTTGPAPNTVVVNSAGVIYGVSQPEANPLVLWRWTTGTGFEKITDLPIATYSNGLRGVSIDSTGRIWGETWNGGANGIGVLWRWSETGGLEKLADFSDEASGPWGPISPVTFMADGTPVGTGNGAIWKWTSGTGLVRLDDLPFEVTGTPSGSAAFSAAGELFGVSSGSPTSVAWKWSSTGGAQRLQVFHSPFEGDYDQGIARDSQGRLYGTSITQGEEGQTSVLWRWSEGDGYEVLASFDPLVYNPNIGMPHADAGGNIYGIAAGPQFSPIAILWRWNETDGLVNLANFDQVPSLSMVFGGPGEIYGTEVSLNFSSGSVWRWTAAEGKTTVAISPSPELTFAPNQSAGADAKWYGIMPHGGSSLSGALFSFSAAEGIVALHDFDFFEGASRRIALAFDPAGNIYGFTSSAKLWKWNPTAGFSTLATFDNGSLFGETPVSLRVDAGGVVRGLCQSGGAYNAGTIWSWSQAGGLCAIHHFNPLSSGEFDFQTRDFFAPTLTDDSAGNLYGVSRGLLWRYAIGTAPGVPIVSLGKVVQNSQVAAIIQGTVNPNGLPTDATFLWGTQPESLTGINTVQPANLSGEIATPVSTTIPGLPPRTVIFGRFSAANAQGTSTSELVTFTTPNNNAPTITDIAGQSIGVNTATSALNFTIGDTETATAALTLTKSSSNPALVPPDNVVFGGSGASRTVTVTPAANQIGTTTITVTVSDGALAASDTFNVNVTATPLQAWRLQYFGAVDNTGAAADLSDPDNDRLPNLGEFALNSDPTASDVPATSVAREDDYLTLTYTRRKTALSEVTVTPLAAGAVEGPWSSTGITEQILNDDGTLETVKARVLIESATQKFLRLQFTHP